jgi:hypothetical protein
MNPQAYGQGAVAPDTAYPVQVVLTGTGKASNAVNFFLTAALPPDAPAPPGE